MALILQDTSGASWSLTINAADGSIVTTAIHPSTPSVGSGAISFLAQDLLSRAGRAAHILASGETFQGNDIQDALTIANGMLDTWSAQRLMIFTIARQVFNLNSGQQTYQFGPGGADWNTARPPRIENAAVITPANPAQPLELPLVPLNKDGWATVPVKAIQASLPSLWYDDQAFPWRNINLWPIPNVSGLQIALYTWSGLTQLSLVGAYSFPPAYYEALVYNIALRLAAEWPGQTTPELQAMAAGALATIKTMNAPIVDLRCDPALSSPALRSYNWISDTPVQH